MAIRMTSFPGFVAIQTMCCLGSVVTWWCCRCGGAHTQRRREKNDSGWLSLTWCPRRCCHKEKLRFIGSWTDDTSFRASSNAKVREGIMRMG